MTANFRELLTRAGSTVERPKTLPAGLYEVQVLDVGKLDKTKGSAENPGGTALIMYPVQVLSSIEVDDKEALAKFGEVRGRKIRAQFFITEDALYRHVDFGKACKLQGDPNAEQIMQQAKGAVLRALVTQRPSNKPGDDTIYNDISKYFPNP